MPALTELTDEYLADILRAVNAPCEGPRTHCWPGDECQTCRRRTSKSIDSIPVVIAALTSARSEIERLRDHPEFDCTDAAHPAWWRGQDHAVWVMCQLVTDLLDGKEIAGVCNEPWETVRKRIATLVKQAASPQN